MDVAGIAQPLRMRTVVDEWTRECPTIDVARGLRSEYALGGLAELLNGEIFYTLRAAQVVIEAWRQEYNRRRPHSSLGDRPPAPEAIQVVVGLGLT